MKGNSQYGDCFVINGGIGGVSRQQAPLWWISEHHDLYISISSLTHIQLSIFFKT